jgi:uncharacterized membrane protein
MKRFLAGRLALLLILLGALALRLFRLGQDSLWYDETVSTFLAGSSLPELIRHTAGDIHPPLYYILLRGWMLTMGYGSGRADPAGIGLEFAAAFLSTAFGVALVALVYALTCRIADRRVALFAAGAVAFSPFNVWYSQEVRMYTMGAFLGALVVYALVCALQGSSSGASASGPPRSTSALQRPATGRQQGNRWWTVYALAAAAGMATLYYFALLLVAVNVWALWRIAAQEDRRRTKKPAPGANQTSRFRAWLRANLVAFVLYLLWLPIAVRQAIDPPVPAWRAAPLPTTALIESWNALALGQSAPGYLWPLLVVILGVYILGLALFEARGQRSIAALLLLATFGPLALILLLSPITPLFHVRYLFTYSPAFYIVVAAGFVWIAERHRAVAVAIAGSWLVVCAVTLRMFWFDPQNRADDLRSAVRGLQNRWRPGDVVLVNAGYAYPPLYTYWAGPIAGRSRLSELLPQPRKDDALVIVATGHVTEPGDSGDGLGWGDPRSDFFALPADVAEQQLAALFSAHPRVWHFRIYDTVNDPNGRIRSLLDRLGRMTEDLVYTGDANMRLQGFAPSSGARPPAGRPRVQFDEGLQLWVDAPATQAVSGDTLYAALHWQPIGGVPDFATSVRLVAPDGSAWSQPTDEKPLGPQFRASQWPVGQVQRQAIALPIPPGTPPGEYSAELVVYDPVTGRPWQARQTQGAAARTPNAVNLGGVVVTRSVESGLVAPALAQFGPLDLVEAASPARIISPGGLAPVEFLWRAREAPVEPLVVVVQLLDQNGRVVAGLEEQPLRGRYPTQQWAAGELVRDRHTLTAPANLAPGIYRLIVGVYRASDRVRLLTPNGLLGRSDYFPIKRIAVQ